eukprot:7390468-Lingulodinium_polyedra.AAC.1
MRAMCTGVTACQGDARSKCRCQCTHARASRSSMSCTSRSVARQTAWRMRRRDAGLAKTAYSATQGGSYCTGT